MSLSFKPEKISISNARKDLCKLVDLVESEPNRIIELDRRNAPAALLLSSEFIPVISAYQSGDLKALLASFVVSKWLGPKNIPPHLSEPQLKELETMGLMQLVILFKAGPSTPVEELMEMGDLDEGLVTRLIKRRKIAEAIVEAEENKLYEVSEHLSNSQ